MHAIGTIKSRQGIMKVVQIGLKSPNYLHAERRELLTFDLLVGRIHDPLVHGSYHGVPSFRLNILGDAAEGIQPNHLILF